MNPTLLFEIIKIKLRLLLNSLYVHVGIDPGTEQ